MYVIWIFSLIRVNRALLFGSTASLTESRCWKQHWESARWKISSLFVHCTSCKQHQIGESLWRQRRRAVARWSVDISVRLSREVMSYLTFSTRAERRALGVWLTAQTVRVFSDTAWGRFPLMCVCVCVCVCARDWTHSSNALRFYSGLPCGAERGGEDTGRKEKWKRGWAGGQ